MTTRDQRDIIPPDNESSGEKNSTGEQPAHGSPVSARELDPRVQVAGESDAGEGESVSQSDTQSRSLSDRKIGAAADTQQQASLQSLADLLRRLYVQKQKRLRLKKMDIAAICSAARIESSEREQLLGLARSDRTLEKTRELMLLSMERFDSPVLTYEVREFVRDVLRRHSAFITVLSSLDNLPERPSEESAVRSLLSQSFSTLPWPEEVAVLKKQEAERCRVNALCCLLLWFRETRGTTFERIHRYLQTNIWAPAARRQKTDSQKLKLLMNTRDPAGLSIVCSILEKQVSDSNQAAAVARAAEEKATVRAAQLEDELSGVNIKLEAATERIEHLANEIRDARRAHENEMAHKRDEYEQLRGRVLHRFKEEVALLDDGLHALRRDPPRVHIMQDHAERAIDGLKREMERIKGDG